MNVVHLISGGDVGGAKTHVLSLLQALNRTDYAHLVCFMEGPFAQEARELGIPTTVIESANLLFTVGQVACLAREKNCCIVHCHGSRANLVGSLVKNRLKIPVITTVHSDYRLDYLGRPFARMTYGVLNALSLRRLDYRIGVSDPTADMLVQRGFDPQRLFSIYNGVPFPPVKPKMSREEYLGSVGLSAHEDTVVFGIAARLSPVKDIGTLIRGFAEAYQAFPHIRLLIAGDGEEREMLGNLASQLCPEGSYAFCGWVTDMDSFYNALDVNMLTSISEAFPYALPEGARMHCATIATRVGGVPYYIEDGVDGLLFRPRDVDALANCIRTMAQNHELRRTLAQRLYEKTERDFSVDATLRRQKEIYETVLRRENRQKRKKDGVMICGAYGRDNAGDDAILESIVCQMRQLDPDIPLYVLTRKPRETAARHRIGAVYTFDYFKACWLLRRTRLYINGGGSLIQDVTSSRSLWYYLLSIATAKGLGNRVLMYGCGIGPVRGKGNRRMAGKVMDQCADVITLREDLSLEELTAMGVSRPQMMITADPAILLQPAPVSAVDALLTSQGIAPDEKIFLIALRGWKDMDRLLPVFADAAAAVTKKHGLRPVFLAMEPRQDLKLCCVAAEQTASRIGGSPLYLRAPEDSSLLIGLIRRAELVVSMRLHALIFGAGVGVPLVGVSYDPKVAGFMRYIGQDRCLPLETITAEALVSAAEAALSGADDLAAQTARLQTLAMENRAAAGRLLEE